MSVRKLLWCVLFAAGLLGCGVADRFGPRAVDYNTEAEAAQLKGLLLNIVRASLRRPMQFTTVSSVTGTASSSSGVSLTLPFGRHQTLAPHVLGVSGNLTGGPTFTVSVLDTQEFYRGVLQPLSGQEYQFFFDEGYTPATLFYLFVDHIDLTTVGDAAPQRFSFRNMVADDFDFERFTAVADYLLRLGMRIEQIRIVRRVGPELAARRLPLAEIAAAVSAGLNLVPAARPASAKAPLRYQAEKEDLIFRPCLSPPAELIDDIDKSLRCGLGPTVIEAEQWSGNLARSGGFDSTALARRLRQIREAHMAQGSEPGVAAALARLPDLPANTRLRFKLYTRSTEGILFYLGSVVRRYLNPEFGRPRIIQLKVGPGYLPYPETPCDDRVNGGLEAELGNGFRCENLFLVEAAGAPAAAALAVDYGDGTYWIPGEHRRAGRTLPILDLVKQLLALHTSAKELPASNVLNIVGP